MVEIEPRVWGVVVILVNILRKMCGNEVLEEALIALSFVLTYVFGSSCANHCNQAEIRSRSGAPCHRDPRLGRPELGWADVVIL